MILRSVERNKYLLFFIVVIIFYCLYYAPFGYDDADNGYTLAVSWRIFNGEIPYKDVILVRPPFSPIFHTLFLFIIPDNYQIIFERFFCYILIACSSLFAALTLNTISCHFKDFSFNPYLLATLGFVFSVRDFPPMPWHTVDGVFFASLGIYILVCSSSVYSITLGMLCLFFSALCKQPFYILPVLGVAYIYLVYNDRRKTVFSIFWLLILFGSFILILYQFNILSSFIGYTSGSTKFKDLLFAGFTNYLDLNIIYFLVPIFIWLLMRRLPALSWLPKTVSVIPYSFISFLILFPLLTYIRYVYIRGDGSIFFRDDIAKSLFVCISFYLFVNFKKDKQNITLCFLIAISWASSISWGYPSPALFSTPLIFGFFLISKRYFEIKVINTIGVYTLSLSLILYFVAYQKPYSNPKREYLTYELTDLFPKLQFIKVDKNARDKYSEFYSLVHKYGHNFKTLPGMPLANYLTNTDSPIKIDWVFNAETNNSNNSIITELASKNTIVFIEKKPLFISVLDSPERFNSSVAFYIKSNWKKVDSTNYFEIYKLR